MRYKSITSRSNDICNLATGTSRTGTIFNRGINNTQAFMRYGLLFKAIRL